MTRALAARSATRPARGVVMIIIASGLFALNGTVSKRLLQGGFDAPQLTAFRAGGGFLGLLLICLLIRPHRRQLGARLPELPRLIGFGLTGFFLVPMFYFVAISRLPVGIGLLLEYTAPIFVALWVRFGARQPVKPRLWAGLALSIAGLAAVAQIWTGRASLDVIGVAAGLICAVLLAGYYLLGSKTVADRDPWSLTCWGFGIAALTGAVIRPWWDFPIDLLGASSAGMPAWLLAAYLLIFGTIIAYLLLSAAMRHLPPTSIGVVATIEPVLASAFAWVLLDELLSPPQILGGLVVLAGIGLAETARTTAGGRNAGDSAG